MEPVSDATSVSATSSFVVLPTAVPLLDTHLNDVDTFTSDGPLFDTESISTVDNLRSNSIGQTSAVSTVTSFAVTPRMHARSLGEKLDYIITTLDRLEANQKLIMESLSRKSANSCIEFDYKFLPVDSVDDMDELSILLDDKNKRRQLVC